VTASPRGLSFGEMAEEYDRWRPGYPGAAVDWLAPGAPATVVEIATPDELEFAQLEWVWELTPAHRAANLATTSMAIAMSPRERDAWLSDARDELQRVCDATGRASMPVRHRASCTRWTPRG
jgi:hypothetical protein